MAEMFFKPDNYKTFLSNNELPKENILKEFQIIPIPGRSAWNWNQRQDVAFRNARHCGFSNQTRGMRV
jgi:hypothetical protein